MTWASRPQRRSGRPATSRPAAARRARVQAAGLRGVSTLGSAAALAGASWDDEGSAASGTGTLGKVARVRLDVGPEGPAELIEFLVRPASPRRSDVTPL